MGSARAIRSADRAVALQSQGTLKELAVNILVFKHLLYELETEVHHPDCVYLEHSLLLNNIRPLLLFNPVTGVLLLEFSLVIFWESIHIYAQMREQLHP